MQDLEDMNITSEDLKNMTREVLMKKIKENSTLNMNEMLVNIEEQEKQYKAVSTTNDKTLQTLIDFTLDYDVHESVDQSALIQTLENLKRP